MTDVDEIKKVFLKYCVDLLTNRKPKPEYEDLIEKKKEIHKERMEEIIENDVEFSEELFDECLKILKKRSNGKYDFILKSGSSLKKCLFSLFKYIWTTEDKPEQWRKTTLIQLHKKGCKDDMSNYRNIHTKTVWFHGDHSGKSSNNTKYVKISIWYCSWSPVSGTFICDEEYDIFVQLLQSANNCTVVRHTEIF